MTAHSPKRLLLEEIEEVPKGLDLEIRWAIKNFSSLPNGLLYSGSHFPFEGVVWYVRYTSHGIKSDSSDDFSVSLGRDERDPPISQEYSVAIESRSGQKYYEGCGKVFGDTARNRQPGPISRSEILRRESEFLDNGVLTVIFTLKSKRSVETGSSSIACGSFKQCQKNKIIDYLEQMLLKRELTDVVIRVDDRTKRPIREYQAHRKILADRSSVFASIFQYDKNLKETGELVIKDCDPPSFGDFLCYLYLGDEDILTDDNAFGLFTASAKFDIFDLRAMCLERIKCNLSVDKFCETVSLGLQHSDSELKRFTTDFFVKNALKILVTAEWKSFLKSNPVHSNKLFVKFAKSVENTSVLS